MPGRPGCQAAQAPRDAARDAPELRYHKPKTPIGRRGESLIIVADYPREEQASPAPLHCPARGSTDQQPEAEKAGGKILKPAAKLKWGGYGGSFADPDGYVWNIGYSAEGQDQPYAE